MGWRVSYYKADKNEPIKITHDIENGYEWDEIEINGEEVANSQGTEFWLELKLNDEFQKEIKCLHDDSDCDYYSITKEGFKRIILAYRNRIIEYHKQAIENDENPDLLNGAKSWERFQGTPKSLLEEELREWQSEYKDEKGEMRYFCIDLTDSKELLSGSWKYKYAIFDMIHVYKHFDWDNFTMVVYGG